MALKTTRWYPDTCECILEYQWDDSVDESNRTHTVSNIVSKCPVHQGIAETDQVYDTVYNKENRRKNQVLQFSLENGPNTLYDVTANGGRILKSNITFTWSWNGTAPNRVLTINFNGISLTNAQKNTIRNVLNNQFGIGNVILS